MQEEKKIGEGSFGIVYLGNFRGNKVAFKRMKTLEDGSGEKALDSFIKEVKMLDKFRSDYVVNFVVTGKASRYEIDDYYFSTSYQAVKYYHLLSHCFCLILLFLRNKYFYFFVKIFIFQIKKYKNI